MLPIVACVTSGLSAPGVMRRAREHGRRGAAGLAAARQRAEQQRADDERDGEIEERKPHSIHGTNGRRRTARPRALSARIGTLLSQFGLRPPRRRQRSHAAAPRPGERPDHARDPRHADHVGLQAEREHRGERRRDERRARGSARAAPATTRRRRARRASPVLDAELGVGRLAGLDLDVRARRRRAGVAEPEALRVLAAPCCIAVAEAAASGSPCSSPRARRPPARRAGPLGVLSRRTELRTSARRVRVNELVRPARCPDTRGRTRAPTTITANAAPTNASRCARRRALVRANA